MHFIKNIFTSIGMVYLFILPVYFPIRALGLEFNAYSEIFNSNVSSILFFAQISIFIAFITIFNSFFIKNLNRYFHLREELLLSFYRAIAIFLSLSFIVSSYFILNPTQEFILYFFSGIHYFIISFFQILIRSELNEFKFNKKVTIEQANNFFGFSLNFFGILSVLIFNHFYTKDSLHIYFLYCLTLEFFFVIYLLFVRKYYKDVRILITEMSIRKNVYLLVYCLFALLFSGLLGILFIKLGIITSIITITTIAYMFYKLKPIVRTSDLKFLINIGLGYGLILALFVGSIVTYFFHSNHVLLTHFNFAYSLEPGISLLLSLLFAYSLIKKKNRIFRLEIYKKLSLINFLVPIVICLSYFLVNSNGFIFSLSVLLFFFYAIIEYFSLYYMRQVVQLEDYNTTVGSQLVCFNVIILNGFVPSMVYILIYILYYLVQLNFDEVLLIIFAFIMIFSFFYNALFYKENCLNA